MRNKYKTDGDITYIYVIRKNQEMLTVLIDTEDLERIIAINKSITLEYKKNINAFYARLSHGEKISKDMALLHRFIMNAPKGKVVDHINHNTLDNRKSNLRICTYSENAQNRKGCMAKSKSGIRGVCWDNTNKTWIARVRVNHQDVFRKTFKNMSDAEKAVIEARKKYMTHSQEAI